MDINTGNAFIIINDYNSFLKTKFIISEEEII